MLVVQWNTRNITEKKTITISITDLEADPHFYKSIHPSKSFNLPNSQCIISYIKISLQHIWYNACDYLLACVVCCLLIVDCWLLKEISFGLQTILCMIQLVGLRRARNLSGFFRGPLSNLLHTRTVHSKAAWVKLMQWWSAVKCSAFSKVMLVLLLVEQKNGLYLL